MKSYRLVKRLGAGGQGEVWEARHPDGSPVALKRAWTADAALLTEARATARLHHPAIVQVLDLGLHEGRATVVQELAPGGALRWEEVEGWAEVRDLLATVLDALAHAHAAGLVHRDLKPANLLCFEEAPRVRLGDFGVATQLGGSGMVVAGSLPFAAPEQLRGEALLPATDLYALGCVAWLLLTGRVPFEGDAEAIEFAHHFSPPPALRPRFAVPPGTEDWLRSLLEKDPEDRPRLAADALAGMRSLDLTWPTPPGPDAPGRQATSCAP